MAYAYRPNKNNCSPKRYQAPQLHDIDERRRRRRRRRQRRSRQNVSIKLFCFYSEMIRKTKMFNENCSLQTCINLYIHWTQIHVYTWWVGGTAGERASDRVVVWTKCTMKNSRRQRTLENSKNSLFRSHLQRAPTQSTHTHPHTHVRRKNINDSIEWLLTCARLMPLIL